MSLARILLADDDLVFCRLVGDLLRKNGFGVEVAHDVGEARQILVSQSFDIMMLDMCFPALREGFELLDEVREQYPGLVVLMISGSGHIPDAVQAIKNGAMDFIEKPIEAEHLLLRIAAVADRMQARRQLEQLEKNAIGMVGKSAAMQAVFDAIIRAAKFDSPVLITGETGVGKELTAHAIHRLSRFGGSNLVSINCASVPRELFEAELFGYEQGAFTGAVKSRKGYFEFANNGNFFLDEVSELPIHLQAKLLRVISEGEIQKLGGTVHPVSIRIISATNQDLEAAVEKGRFRQDFYYRLKAIQVHIPPLRSRPEDIPPLAQHFLIDFCTRNQIQPTSFTPAALNWLCQQPWKGNGRELRHSVEQGVIFAKGESLDVVNFTTATQHHEQPSPRGANLSLRDALHQYEQQLIEFYLAANNHNVTRTAERLGLDKSNLFKKIRQYGIRLPE